jgi:hypothetical protein
MTDISEVSAVKASAYFESNLESIKLVKRLTEIQAKVKIDGIPFVCVPSVPSIAKRLGVEAPVVARGMEGLVKLKWARRYIEGKKTLYAIGTPLQSFMEKELEQSFAKARRTTTGRIKKTEWRWLPLDHWNGLTLWLYMSESFRRVDIWPAFASSKGQAQLQRICGRVGIRKAKQVGDYFIKNWRKLKKHFKWAGNPSPGLFTGYFWTLMDCMKNGIATYQHDRKHETDTGAEEKWKEFDGT